MKKFSELSLFRRMVSMFLFVFLYTLLITLWFVLPISTDKGATLASCLSVGATLYAAIVAYLLLDNWKVQHRENLKSNYFQENFDKYVDLENAISTLQNLHDYWLAEIHRNHYEIGEFEDGGLIKQILSVKAHLREITNRFEYYQIIFSDKSYETAIKSFESELNQLLNPILNQYYECEGEVDNLIYLRNAELFKNKLPLIVQKYNDSIYRMMSKDIILK